MIVLIFILGCLMGSFYLVVGTRGPLKDNILLGRSRCDNCKMNLKWYELIPLFSYICQRGKCRNCQKKISIIHLIMELVTAILFVIGYLYYGMVYEYLIYLILISVMLVIFVSDFQYMIIMDSTLVVGSILILIVKLICYGTNTFLLSILNGLLLFLVMIIIKFIGNFLFKKEALGGGDIKLAFLIGLTIGFRLGLISLIFASFLALPYALAIVYLNKKNELPYGPFLISATVIIYIFIEKFSNLFIFF